MFRQTIKITNRLTIPEAELRFTASRSSGPGGQNVNKVSSRVTLWFDVLHSPSLSAEERDLVLTRLHSRINKDGLLRVTSQESRSQAANREAAIRRFADILRSALQTAPVRRTSSISQSANLCRLSEKRQRSLLKKERSYKPSLDT